MPDAVLGNHQCYPEGMTECVLLAVVQTSVRPRLGSGLPSYEHREHRVLADVRMNRAPRHFQDRLGDQVRGDPVLGPPTPSAPCLHRHTGLG